MSGRRAPAARQRGVALLTAVVLVALATVVATAIAFDTTLAARRGGGAAAFEQAGQIAGGAEALAAVAIAEYRKQQNAPIHPGQAWAQPIGPVEVVPGAVLEAKLVDLQGRFNLNNLTTTEGTENEAAVEVFRRLLENVGVEPDWAIAMVDWIDDDIAMSPGGAEDSVYSSETPGYRTPNRPITNASEMLALKGFGMERWVKVAPFVTALPRGVGVNLCTASAALLDAMSNQQQWTLSPDALQRARAGKCFPDAQTFNASVSSPADLAKLNASMVIGETSNWFQVRTLATIGTSDFALYSLLHYEQGAGGGRVRVLARTFTE
ncbi:MAG: type II secretion system minor pseudopilin GspK [Steroidobacteraceae bacterium]|jgi:general secretion pathway protein K|nr:type II secretion system minor pseudopilin GspK [Steroidobacteraceae bacterium]